MVAYTVTMTYPRTYSADDAPRGVLDAVAMLMPLLLAGDESDARVLREQFAASTISKVELTGRGFSVDFTVPATVAATASRSFSGGDAGLGLTTSDRGGGCLVHVRGGRLHTLQVYVWDGAWTEETALVTVEDVVTVCDRPLPTYDPNPR